MAPVGLPDDIIFEEILIRLPFKLLVRFRYVCKLWNSVLSDPDFMQPSLNRSISQHPNDEYLIRTWPGGVAILSRTDLCEYPIDNIPYPVPCGDHVRLLGSINGIVCLARLSKSHIRFILWNPAIHLFKEILLTEHCCSCPENQNRYRLGFSWDSVANDFKLIATCARGSFSSCVHSGFVYSSKTNCWSNIADPPRVKGLSFPSVIVKGIPYWKCFKLTAILKFEARSNEFAYLPPVSKDVGKVYNLVNLNDCLARIEYAVEEGTDSMDVYQFNEENNSWCKMFTVNFKKNSMLSSPTMFKYGSEIVFNGSFYLSGSESNKIKHLTYQIHRYSDIHGHTYTPSLVVLEGMEPLHLGERSLRTSDPEAIRHLEQRLKPPTTIFVKKPNP